MHANRDRFALGFQYDADRVLQEHWKPALDAIMERANAGWSAGTLPAPGTGRLASDEERDAVTDALSAMYNGRVIGAPARHLFWTTGP